MEWDSSGSRKGKLSKHYCLGGGKEVPMEDSGWKITKEDVSGRKWEGRCCQQG